ncbi:MAG TPA: 2-oxoacid:acceptor oxidoreductase family protein [Candidatus Hydrogenedentes bacterium]|nr:2-oxoacid:acceptor oxidoreductase family protein [Candidatus Hydrogenedentota bacterium]HPG69910.1 2-oxoacid:acceptor oxidoreductase family protein [Candidatus Hydrogenedentota bacterium]
MSNTSGVVNVVVAGLGGQGAIKASDILSDAAFEAGRDVKKSEIHGMSQRGGSVTSDVRFGDVVLSPMVTAGEADYLLVLDSTQVENNQYLLADDGVLIAPDRFLEAGQSLKSLDADASSPLNSRSFNVAMLGVLSAYVDIPDECWAKAIQANLPAKVHEQNFQVFALGKERGKQAKG